MTDWKNKLYFGDNLEILRSQERGAWVIPSESVDLIYLDPPFNSNASYNVLFGDKKTGGKSQAQITAFEDTWHWTTEPGGSAEAYDDAVLSGPPALGKLLPALRAFLGENDMMAYLAMMAVRLAELHRVLKPTGSIYLHCDPTASHYLKLLMDAVFGLACFRNEIIWKRTSAHNSARRYGPVHDTLLFYTKTDAFTWNAVFQPYDSEYLETFFAHSDPDGRRWKRMDLTGPGLRQGDCGQPWGGYDPSRVNRHWQPPSYCYTKYEEITGEPLGQYELLDRLTRLDTVGLIHWPKTKGGLPHAKLYLDDCPGVPLQDVWTDIRPTSNLTKERLGYPTQKPVALLERIIQASSNEGDVVLDPFCGCGTTIAAAEKLRRRWIGIDVTHLAIGLIENRLAGVQNPAPYEVFGVPKDLPGARDLAQRSAHEFEWWAVSMVKGRPAQDKRKGADRGIDGVIPFFDDDSGQPKRAIISVKSGHVTVSQIRDLKGVLEREKEPIGVFITLEEPTRPMREEAAAAGFYEPPMFPGARFPRIQILTIAELFDGKTVQRPGTSYDIRYKEAPKVERDSGQGELF